MTPRHSVARLLVRALAVLGGTGVLMILGSAMAGAAPAPPTPAPGLHVAVPLPLPTPAPAPIAISVPLPLPPALAPVLAPVEPAGTPVALHTPLVDADLGLGGIAVTVDPPVVVPTPGLPTRPIPTLGVGDPVATPGVAPPPAVSTTTAGSRGATLRASRHDRDASSAAPIVAVAVDRPGSAPAPAPRPHGVPMQFMFELAGIAAGLELSARRRGAADPVPVCSFVPAIRDLIRLGAIPRGLPPAAPPGFGLLLARPG